MSKLPNNFVFLFKYPSNITLEATPWIWETLINFSLAVKIVYYYILKASLIKQKTSKKTKSIASVKRGVHVIINEGLKMLKKGLNISKFR